MPANRIKVILARSPYQVIIDEDSQTSTKVELRLWNKGETRPTNPTYIMSEGIASVTQTQTNYNISPFILEYIDKFYPEYYSQNVALARNEEWCIGEYKTYFSSNTVDNQVIDVVEFCGVNGYSTPEQGMNYDPAEPGAFYLMANPNIKVYWKNNYPDFSVIPFYNFIVRDAGEEYKAEWFDKSEQLLNSVTFYDGEDAFFNYAIPLVYANSTFVIISRKNEGAYYKIETEEICEPLYPVEHIRYVNNYGGWGYLAFFKASYNSINVKNSDYALMQKEVNYEQLRGQTKPFNINGNGSMKVNTGWITEDYFELIQDVMLSDTIIQEDISLTYYRPLIIKTSTMQKKTYLTEKNINYTLEFDFANKLINNII
jgi:hypothetical protein